MGWRQCARVTTTHTTFGLEWVPVSCRVLAVGNFPRGTGVIAIYETNSGKIALTKQVEKKGAFKCVSVGLSRNECRHFATGDFDGNVCVWNVEQPEHAVFSVVGHSSLVNGLDSCGGSGEGDGPLEIASAGRDGCVRVWDVRQKTPAMELLPDNCNLDCWCTAFGTASDGADRVVAAGYANGDVRVFDLRQRQTVWEAALGEHSGVCGVEFDSRGAAARQLLVSCVNSQAHVFSFKAGSQASPTQHSTKVHESTVWCGKHVPQRPEFFATGGSDGDIVLSRFDAGQSKVVEVERHSVSSQAVVDLAWHRSKPGMCVASCLDQSLVVLHNANLEI